MKWCWFYLHEHLLRTRKPRRLHQIGYFKTFLLVLCLACDLSSVLGSTLHLTRQLTLQPELGNLALRSDLLYKDRSLVDCGNLLS